MTHKASYSIILLLIAMLVFIVSQSNVHSEQTMWILAGVLLLIVVVLALNLYKIAYVADISVSKQPQKSKYLKQVLRAALWAMIASILIFFFYFVDILKV